MLDTIKSLAERVTGIARPSGAEASGLVRSRKPWAYMFRDDGLVPNHPDWPLIVYRSPVKLPDTFDPAAIFEALFAEHDWGGSWRNGIYDYTHYHSRTHEVLGIARGHATVRFGGERGRAFRLKAGDVAILPAGTGHRALGASKDLLVVGAYPPSGTYDECSRASEHDEAAAAIPDVPRPQTDPVYGPAGPLTTAWAQRRRRPRSS